jgi:hypothetical protein
MAFFQEMRRRSVLAVILQKLRGSDEEFIGFLAPPEGGVIEFYLDETESFLTGVRTQARNERVRTFGAERLAPGGWSD